MSFHGCPIEPSDWTDGPDDSGDCRECEGCGTYQGDDGAEHTCESCGGTGFVEYEPFEDDFI